MESHVWDKFFTKYMTAWWNVGIIFHALYFRLEFKSFLLKRMEIAKQVYQSIIIGYLFVTGYYLRGISCCNESSWKMHSTSAWWQFAQAGKRISHYKIQISFSKVESSRFSTLQGYGEQWSDGIPAYFDSFFATSATCLQSHQRRHISLRFGLIAPTFIAYSINTEEKNQMKNDLYF